MAFNRNKLKGSPFVAASVHVRHPEPESGPGHRTAFASPTSTTPTTKKSSNGSAGSAANRGGFEVQQPANDGLSRKGVQTR